MTNQWNGSYSPIKQNDLAGYRVSIVSRNHSSVELRFSVCVCVCVGKCCNLSIDAWVCIIRGCNWLSVCKCGPAVFSWGGEAVDVRVSVGQRQNNES